MIQKKISEAEFNKIHRIKALREALEISLMEYQSGRGSLPASETPKPLNGTSQFSRLDLLNNELTKMARISHLPEFHFIADLVPGKFNPEIADSLTVYFDSLDKLFSQISNAANDTRDRFYNLNQAKLKKLENEYYNYKLLEIVTKPYERKKILIHNNSLIQNTDMIYLDSYNTGLFGFRTHFYAPDKCIFGIQTDTFIFNISLVLASTIFLYLMLYFELPGRVVSLIGNFRIRK